MKTKLKVLSFLLLIMLSACGLAFLPDDSGLARRIQPVFANPTKCSENQVFYNMVTHKFLVCDLKDHIATISTIGGTAIISSINGLIAPIQFFGTGTAGTDFNIVSNTATHTFNFPNSSATARGLLTAGDWSIFNNKQAALGYTPESLANKNATNGYAGLSAGLIARAQMQEVLSVQDLTEYIFVSGRGDYAIRATFTALSTDDCLKWDGSDWVNSATCGTGGGGGGAPTNATYITQTANGTLTNEQVLSFLATGLLKNTSGTGVLSIAVPGTDYLTPTGSGSALTGINFSQLGGSATDLQIPNNITIDLASVATLANSGDSATAFFPSGTLEPAIGGIGINLSGVAKGGLITGSGAGTFVITTVGTNGQVLTANSAISGGVEWTAVSGTGTVTSFSAGTLAGVFTTSVANPTTTPALSFALATQATNIVFAGPASGGVATPTFRALVDNDIPDNITITSFTQIGGTATDAQVPDIHSVTKIANLTTNGFVKTSAGDGTLLVDTNTYLTGNQTITLTGNVTGSGTTSIATTIANNVVNGAMIAMGSDTQGDVLYYNGTDYVRLGAGTSGQFLKTQGAGANPIWATAAGTGDVTGPSSSTDNAIARFDLATGKLIQNSVVIVSDVGVISGASFPTGASPAVIANGFYRDTVDGKFYVGSANGLQWHELYESGVSLVNLTAGVIGLLPMANGGTGVNLADPNADRILFWDDSAGAMDWLTLGTGLTITGTTINASGGGTGDFVGPSSATDNAIVRFDTTTGKLGQNSLVTITDTGGISSVQGSIAANDPFLNHTATWNNAGITFTNIKSNITDTASNAASLLMDLQVNSSSKFKVTKTGAITSTGDFSNAGFDVRSTTYNQNSLVVLINATGITVGSASYVGFNSATATNSGAVDVAFIRNGVGIAEVDSGVAGTYRDLLLRKLYFSGTTVYESSGTGTPESVVTAGIGSTFRRTDGGAGTTFYVKESGAGNTGWVGIGAAGGGGAPIGSTYITQTADGTLTNEQALGALATGILKNTTTTGVLSIATAGTDYSSPSSTDTFTNKTLDVEGTGNIFTTYTKIWFPAGGCNNATASSLWDLPTTTPAVAACVTGTNTQKGVLDFADTSGGFSAQNSYLLPSAFTGAIDARIIWSTTATSGNAKWSLSTICTAVDATETDDAAFNTASTVTTAAPGTANRLQTSSITAVTITGCAANEYLHVKVFRDGNDASDTIAATARLVGVELTVREAK